MVNRKNWIKLFAILIVSILASILLIAFSCINIDGIIEQSNAFQYNAISMAAIIGGFLFTGIGILISAIDKERIKRLWENNYLDNLYRAAFVGMISNIITISAAFILLVFNTNESTKEFLVSIEVVSIVCGIVFFTWCIKHLVFIIKRMKSK